jgi:succinoglycan biosynthesis protein ExoA
MSARVLAVIPCLNEAAHIETVAMKLLGEADALGMRIVIADGGSSDGTRDIAGRLAAAHERIVFLDNPRRLQSAALNLAAQVHGAECEFLIRVDAHGDFPAHYCRSLLETQAKTCADSVVVAWLRRAKAASSAPPPPRRIRGSVTAGRATGWQPRAAGWTTGTTR